ncbi:SAWADEE domain-containing protein [Forsythia ovata]|uniref:SAWADEE domain-containing protein n=1 Tax=Forsythia ovata TaxID=205694 RepID=A0ABD1S0P8_9LAMI
MTKNSCPDQLRDEDTGGGSFHMNEFVETGIHHFLLVENLELDLSSTTIREFIYNQTSISSQAYVFPRRSSEPYAREAIVSECKTELEKIYDFLNNNNRLVVSKNGRLLKLLPLVRGRGSSQKKLQRVECLKQCLAVPFTTLSSASIMSQSMSKKHSPS